MSLWAVVLLPGSVRAGGNDPNARELVRNPHGDSSECIACHTSTAGGRETLRFNGSIAPLCESCHNGRTASREAHVVNIAPSGGIVRRIPPDFPLQHGTLTCLSCHDVVRDCKGEPSGPTPSRSLTRGAGDPLMFCFLCHALEDYRPFNPHDQLDGGKPKTGACLWCHVEAPPVDSQPHEATSYGLRAESARLCKNCHVVAEGHPVVSHMRALPSAEMTWYMSAHEMQSKMRLPLARLLEYARVNKRMPRSIPLDESGRITCHSCHNPHEKGLLPNENPRSIGAEPTQAVSHRLRVQKGIICVACHQK